MNILEDLSDAEVVKLAARPTPKPMVGEWTLTAPDGRTWKAQSPIHCVQAESNSRIPPDIALARIRASLIEQRDRVSTLTEMAYLLKLVPRGDIVPVQFLELVGKQFDAAMAAAGIDA